MKKQIKTIELGDLVEVNSMVVGVVKEIIYADDGSFQIRLQPRSFGYVVRKAA